MFFPLFLSNILLCNILTAILRPNFEEPLDTANQLVENDIKLYSVPVATNLYKQFLKQSNVHEYTILGDNMIVSNWSDYWNIHEHGVMGEGTHALLAWGLDKYEQSFGRWHRSQEKLSGWPVYVGYMTNKKWQFNEVESNIHRSHCWGHIPPF